MGAVNRNSVLYAAKLAKTVLDARDGGGRVVPIPFEFTVVSASTANDTYNLATLPAGCEVVGLECTTDGLGPSAGGGRTFQIGDSGDNDRYMAATDFDVVNASGVLAFAGMRYRPTADTVVVGLIGGAAGVVGKKVKGCMFIVPGA